jgi:hypothetical protein
MGGNRKHLAMTITPNKWELDVQGYLNVCNITSATPRKQIRDFSAGVNDLGLWNSMVCWPLRSSQNYGSGDTVFSLGGLGTFNGTRVNGPTWGADGITITGANKRIDFPTISDFSSGLFAGSIHKVASVSTANRGLSIEKISGQAGGAWAPFSDGKLYWDCLTTSSRISENSGAANDTFYMWSGSSNGMRICLNNNSLATGGTASQLTGDFDRIQFGRTSNNTTEQFNGTSAFIFIIKTGASLSQIQAFYNTCRDTLGTGLSLP